MRFSHMGANRRIYGQSVKASHTTALSLYPYLPPSRSISLFQAACRLLRHQRNKSYLTEPTDISRACVLLSTIALKPCCQGNNDAYFLVCGFTDPTRLVAFNLVAIDCICGFAGLVAHGFDFFKERQQRARQGVQRQAALSARARGRFGTRSARVAAAAGGIGAAAGYAGCHARATSGTKAACTRNAQPAGGRRAFGMGGLRTGARIAIRRKNGGAARPCAVPA